MNSPRAGGEKCYLSKSMIFSVSLTTDTRNASIPSAGSKSGFFLVETCPFSLLFLIVFIWVTLVNKSM